MIRAAFRVAIDELRVDRRRGQEVDVAIPPPELAGLTDALRQLSPNQRAAIVLRHVMDLDVPEIADRMGIAQPTVRVHLHRGRKRLRELLGVEEVDLDARTVGARAREADVRRCSAVDASPRHGRPSR